MTVSSLKKKKKKKIQIKKVLEVSQILFRILNYLENI